MTSTAKLEQLLGRVRYRAEYNVVEGIDVFRRLLEDDRKGDVLRFLKAAFSKLEGRVRGGIAYVIAEHYRKQGDVGNLRRLIQSDDACVRESVLNALWGEPGAKAQMGPAIVELALAAARDPSPAVRTGASYVLQNQGAWGFDVSAGIGVLRSLLDDRIARVRHQAGFAVGNLAKAKYDMSSCIGRLRRNVKHKDMYVRESSAWALWQMSRHRHDIAAAVPELVWLLTDAEEYDEPRKQAAGALMHHAKKSPQNAQAVKTQVEAVVLDARRKEIKRFVDNLARLS